MTDTSEVFESDVPIWPDLLRPVLTVLSGGEVLHRKTLFDRAADEAGLSDSAKDERLNTGGLRYEQRMGWVLSHSVKAGWVDRPSRGHYQINNHGREWLERLPQTMSHSEARELFAPFWPAPASKSPSTDPEVASTALDYIEPVEQIENGVNRIRNDVGVELLERLRQSHPDFFERAVLQLLLAMGYGGADQRGKRIGGSHDGGVDGVIDQDALGLDRVYIQAKRYQEGSNIGREAIQAFVGALHGVGAAKGIFISTSDFTQHAREYSKAVPSQIILISGKRLVDLMIEYSVGVQTKETYRIVDIDEDFFE